MKSILRKILFILKISLGSPLLLGFYVSSEQQIITADVKCWEKNFDWQTRHILTQLVLLLQEAHRANAS